MTPQEFKEKYIDEDGNLEDGAELVESGESIVEYKTVYSTDVYSVGGEYFAVDYSWDNTGYYSDGEVYETQVRKVLPAIKSQTYWVDVIENS